MVPKLFKGGKSFRGLARYLSYDLNRETRQRVPWTYTRNLAHDDVSLAVDEMLWTYRAAESLKRAAGLAPGGRPLTHPVKHFSLNWSPDEAPSREHMIETVNSFLDRMGWGEFQAIVWCHTDKHPHVHVMVNAVHPETGRALDTGFEWRRSQAWALDYEREHGLQCEQRLLPPEQREASPTRESWMRMKEAERLHHRAEADRRAATPTPDYFARHDPELHAAKEWELLKTAQRRERENHFAQGKQAFRKVRNAIFREVRTEFRKDWKAYYGAKRSGAEPYLLNITKADILARQNAELESRRDPPCAALRKERDGAYTQLLAAQRTQRAELAARQARGAHSRDLLNQYAGGGAARSDDRHPNNKRLSSAFRQAAKEMGTPAAAPKQREAPAHAPYAAKGPTRTRVRGPIDMTSGLGVGALGAFAEIGERLFDGFFGGAAAQEEGRQQRNEAPRVERENNTPLDGQHAQAAEDEAREVRELQEYWQRRKRERGRDR